MSFFFGLFGPSNQELLDAVRNLESTMVERLEAMEAKLDKFLADNAAYIAKLKEDVNAQLAAARAEAVANDDQAEVGVIDRITAKIEAAMGGIPAPEFPASNL